MVRSVLTLLLFGVVVNKSFAEKSGVHPISYRRFDYNCESKYGCSKLAFTFDTCIAIIYKGNHDLTVSEDNYISTKTELKIYKATISLDSIYKAHVRNKSLPYFSQFYCGSYVVQGNILSLRLTFLNGAINSNKSTSHTYWVRYNIVKGNVVSLRLAFER